METLLNEVHVDDDQMLLEKIHQLGPELGQDIESEENNRRLSKKVLNLLRENELHRLFLPASLGGLEMNPVAMARLVEAVATYNTAAGWSMMVANVSTWWSWRLPEKGVEEVFLADKNMLIAGAFHPPMAATRVKGGFRINGRSPLASNVNEANWIFVTAMVMEGEQPKMNNGIPEIVGVMMRAGDCRIIDTWHTLGMKATDSNDVAAENVFVPDWLSYPLAPGLHPNSYFAGPLYRFPAIGASIASLISPVALAVASNAIREVKILATKKTSFGSFSNLATRGAVQSKLGKAEALVASARAYLWNELEMIWKKTLEGKEISLEEKAGLLLAATHTNQSCFQAVDLMYSVAGTTGIYMRSKLAHYFTDAQVIRQHGFANESRYETVAQVLLSLQPDLPVLAF